MEESEKEHVTISLERYEKLSSDKKEAEEKLKHVEERSKILAGNFGEILRALDYKPLDGEVTMWKPLDVMLSNTPLGVTLSMRNK